MYLLLIVCSSIMLLKAFEIAGGKNFPIFLIYITLMGFFLVEARKEKD